MLISLVAAVLPLIALPLQDGTPPVPPVPGARAKSEALDEQGRELVPGVLPANTPADAAERWNRTCNAHLAPGTERRAVSAFDVALDVRYKASDTQTNDFQARYRYLSPSFLRATTESRREQIRGPDGDWLLDPATNEKIRLDIGRTNEEDRRQLDESVAIAKNFVALFDPRSLRIASIATRASAPQTLPASTKARAEKCAWLDVVSPDFHLHRSKAGSKTAARGLVRVALGIEPETSRVAYALIYDGASKVEIADTTLFIELEKFKELDGFVVPHHIRVFETERTRGPTAFRTDPSSDIYVVAGKANLRATLTPADFKP
jgi:hypothetical protein